MSTSISSSGLFFEPWHDALAGQTEIFEHCSDKSPIQRLVDGRNVFNEERSSQWKKRCNGIRFDMGSFELIQPSDQESETAIYRLKTTWLLWWFYPAPCSIFLIRLQNKKYVLVDPGFERWKTDLKKAAEEIIVENGSEPAKDGKLHQDIVALIATHKHDDHIGVAKSLLKERDDLLLFIGEQDAPHYRKKGNNPDGLDFSDTFRERCGTDLKLIHTSGHTPGHLSVLHVTLQTILSGDAMINFRKCWPWHENLGGPLPPTTQDMKAARSSIQMLTKLRPSELQARRNSTASTANDNCESTNCPCVKTMESPNAKKKEECNCTVNSDCVCNVWKRMYVSHDRSGREGIPRAAVMEWAMKH